MTEEVQIPDLAEPIRAWRAWGIQDDGETPVLTSVNGSIWHNESHMTAVCRKPVEGADPGDNPKLVVNDEHQAPEKDCGFYGYGCGLYAYKSLPELLWNYDPVLTEGTLVFGEVLLFGKVYEYENGYRAEHAKIARITFFKDRPVKEDLYGRLARVYDVPAECAPMTEREVLHKNLHRARAGGVASATLNMKLPPAAMNNIMASINEQVKEIVRRNMRSDLWWGVMFALFAFFNFVGLPIEIAEREWWNVLYGSVFGPLFAWMAYTHLSRRKYAKQFTNQEGDEEDG